MCELSPSSSSRCLAHKLCLSFIVIVSTLGFTCIWKQDKLPWEITLWLNDWYSTKRWEKRRNQINFRFINGYIIYYLSYLWENSDRGCPITGIEFQLFVIWYLKSLSCVDCAQSLFSDVRMAQVLESSKRASLTVSVTWERRCSHVTLTVTLACLLVLRSAPRIFEEKRDCSQFSSLNITEDTIQFYSWWH